MKMARYKIRYLLVGVVVLVLGVSTVMAQQRLSTSGAAFDGSFTYQGRLDGADGPVTAVCDLQVGLWDAASAGTQLGSTETLTDVAVTEGLFTVLLNTQGDFGAQVFDGDPRYLEIAVQCGSETTFTTLAPRHALTPAPYALTSGSTQALQGNVVSDAAPVTGESLVWDGSHWGPQMAGEPSGIMILTESATPPDGYTATGFIAQTSNTNNTAWMSKTAMPTARSGMVAGVVDGKIYVIGGDNNGDEVEEYDPATDTWTTKTAMPTPRSYAVAGVVDGKIYVIGGDNNGDEVEEYDPATDTWTTKTAMPTAREVAAAGVVDGKIYVIGGDNNGDEVEEYDPATDTWTTKTAMPTPRWYAVAGVVDGKIYVIGGAIGGPPGMVTVEEYDPATDTWTTKTAMPTARLVAVAGVVDGKIYVIGGFTTGPVGIVEAYDPATDSWTTKTSMTTSRFFATAGVADEKIYVIGGDGGAGDEVEEYDPAAEATLYIHVKN